MSFGTMFLSEVDGGGELKFRGIQLDRSRLQSWVFLA